MAPKRFIFLVFLLSEYSLNSKADSGRCTRANADHSSGVKMLQLKVKASVADTVADASEANAAVADAAVADAAVVDTAEASADAALGAAAEVDEHKNVTLDAHGCRKIITYTQMLPEDEDRPANFPVYVSDIAIALISGRHEFFNTSHSAVLRYAPHGVLIKVRAACPCSFRAAFRRLKAHYPNAKWYYVGDEDAILNLEGLAAVLSKYDSSKPTLVAANGNHTICASCGVCPTIFTTHGVLNTNAFFGGAGQVMSTRLLEHMDLHLKGACTEADRPTLSGLGDLENTCTLARWWDQSTQFVQLKMRHASFHKFWDNKTRFINAHHLCTRNIRLLSGINRHMPTASKELIFLSNSDNDGCEQGPMVQA